jgi:hypothetical protein
MTSRLARLQPRAARVAAHSAITLLLLTCGSSILVAQSGPPPDTVVKSATKPVHAGKAALQPEVTIGLVEGAEEYLFGDITELAVAGDGSIYVFDRQVPALRKYDSKGKFVRTLGRKGQGPGEYLSGGGLAVLPDGKVLLWDTGTWRINVYSPEGEYIRSLPTPSGFTGTGTLVTSRSLLVDSAGAIYVKRILRMPRRMEISRTVWVKMRSDGTVLDTIPVPELGVETPSVTAQTTNSSSSANVPFAPRALTALSPFGYFVTAFPNRYAFELRPLKPARQIVSVRREVQPERVSAEERNDARSKIESQMRRVDPGWNWNGPDIPRFKPAFENVAIGTDGRVWVAVVQETAPRSGGSFGIGSGRAGGQVVRPTPSNEPPKAGLYDVFERDGTYVGQVALPLRFTAVFRRGDQLWGIGYDEDEVATVKRFRVAWR